MGDVIAGVANVIAFIKDTAEKVKAAVQRFTTTLQAIMAPVSDVLNAMADFTAASADIHALATIESPVYDTHLPAMSHPDARRLTEDTLPPLLTTIVTSYDSVLAAHADLQADVTAADELDTAVRQCCLAHAQHTLTPFSTCLFR